MKVLLEELVGLIAQVAVFTVGLAGSVAVGMVMAMQVSSIGGLIVATVVAGAGLLGAASVSQTVRDRIAQKQLERTLNAAERS